MKDWLKRIYYRLYYRNKKVSIGKNAVLNTKNYFEGLNAVGENSHIASSSLGCGTYVADKSVIKHTKIGKYCSIGSNVQTGLGIHPAKTFVSTHPAFFSTQKQAGFSFVKENRFEEQIFTDTEKKYVVQIGNDVWIANNVIIIDGVTIGDGAIIAAGSVVTKDIPHYSIFAGVPARFVRLRFTASQIETLLKVQWWNWDLRKIQSQSNLFNDVDAFISSVKP